MPAGSTWRPQLSWWDDGSIQGEIYQHKAMYARQTPPMGLQIMDENWVLWHPLWHWCLGSIDGRQGRSELGTLGDVLMKLASTLPDDHNYKICADNYFTSVSLVVQLLDRGLHYVGTAGQVRLPNCVLEDEKSLKKKGRGALMSGWRQTTTSVLWDGTTTGQSPMCHALLAQNLLPRFNIGPKPPNPMQRLRGLTS